MTQSMDDRDRLQRFSTIQTGLVWKYDQDGWCCEVNDADSVRLFQTIYDRLQITPQQLTEFCQRWQIAELAVFGSILREDFRWDGDNPSDIDFLFIDRNDAPKNLILQVRMKCELEDLLHRSIDLVSKTAIMSDPNYIRRQNILESAQVIYVER